MDFFEIGEAVRQARKAKGLTQAELANRVGLSRYTIIRFESGQVSDLGLRKVLSILTHLGLQLSISPWQYNVLPTLEDMYKENEQERAQHRARQIRIVRSKTT